MDYTPSQAGAMLNRSPRTIQRWIKKGMLRAVELNGRFYISEDSLQEFKENFIKEYVPTVKTPGHTNPNENNIKYKNPKEI